MVSSTVCRNSVIGLQTGMQSYSSYAAKQAKLQEIEEFEQRIKTQLKTVEVAGQTIEKFIDEENKAQNSIRSDIIKWTIYTGIGILSTIAGGILTYVSNSDDSKKAGLGLIVSSGPIAFASGWYAVKLGLASTDINALLAQRDTVNEMRTQGKALLEASAALKQIKELELRREPKKEDSKGLVAIDISESSPPTLTEPELIAGRCLKTYTNAFTGPNWNPQTFATLVSRAVYVLPPEHTLRVKLQQLEVQLVPASSVDSTTYLDVGNVDWKRSERSGSASLSASSKTYDEAYAEFASEAIKQFDLADVPSLQGDTHTKLPFIETATGRRLEPRAAIAPASIISADVTRVKEPAVASSLELTNIPLTIASPTIASPAPTPTIADSSNATSPAVSITSEPTPLNVTTAPDISSTNTDLASTIVISLPSDTTTNNNEPTEVAVHAP